jgi:agmatinase
LVGIPYDGTSSYCPGSRFGPDALRMASDSLETYDPLFGYDLADIPLGDAGNMCVSFGDPKSVVDHIRAQVKGIMGEYPECRFLFIGGEHLISLPAVSCLRDKYHDLMVIQFDAHADLRDEYAGERLSHATVMRRIVDVVGGMNVYQFGARSGTREEFMFGTHTTHFYPFGLNMLSEAAREIRGKPVYLTVDLDILDPSCMPGVGNQEPGGPHFEVLEKALLSLKGIHLVGADIVELCPLRDSNGISAVAAAKMARQILMLLYDAQSG